MDTYALIQRYREQLGFPAEEAIELVAKFVDRLEMRAEFKRFLLEETGVDLDPDERLLTYKGKQFAVFAYHESFDDTGKAAERVDVDTEVLALEAFSTLLSSTDFRLFIIVQFNQANSSSRELLRYDRGSSGRQW